MMPRLLLAAPSSGCGKTTVTCALLQALVEQGLHPMACKAGPDYIDPMFHSQVIGAKSINLDLFFCTPPLVRGLLQENSKDCDVTILEGAMGYYDGIGCTTQASAWELAQVTETPVILVVDGRGRSVSAAAEVAGFLHFRPHSAIAGVIFNRLSPALYPQMAEAVKEATGLPSFGYLPNLPECTIESRHLGLKTAQEIADLRIQMHRLAQAAKESLDLSGLLALAQSAPVLTDSLPEISQVTDTQPVVAVARDRAFCFYYEDSLNLLRKMGVKLIDFSPLKDAALPAQCAGVYLGGGYPELYAQALSENHALRQALRERILDGMPTLAECGGFLYLQRFLEDDRGEHWPMVGVFSGKGYSTGRLQRFGYATMTAKKPSLLFQPGEQIPIHEFHYWNVTDPGCDLVTKKPHSQRQWDNAIATPTLYAGFPHLHFWAAPQCAERFVAACARYQEEHL